MRFPNLISEFEAVSGCDLPALADRMNVTEELLHDILYNDAEFSIEEGFAAFDAFKWNHRPYEGLNNYDMNYLYARGLATLNPRKSKNRYRLYLLKKRLSQAIERNPNPVSWLHGPMLEKATSVCERMTQGEWVTYAEYRNCFNDMAVFIAAYQNKQPRKGSEESRQRYQEQQATEKNARIASINPAKYCTEFAVSFAGTFINLADHYGFTPDELIAEIYKRIAEEAKTA